MRTSVRGMGRGDDGFVLLETIVAISLIGVVMAAFTTFFVNTVVNTNQQRAKQVATQIADSAIEKIRSLPASDLVTGRDSTSVASQLTGSSAIVKPWLASMATTVDPLATIANVGQTATIPTIAVVQTVNAIAFNVNTYLGTCAIKAGDTVNASCVDPTTISAGIVTNSYLRAVVAVTWSGAHCYPAACTYVTSTLISPDSDPTFNLTQVAPPLPVVINPGAQVSTVGDVVRLQLAVVANTGVPTFTWAVTAGALPAGLAMTPTGLILGTATTLQPATPLTVTVTDAFGRTAGATFTWAVVAKPTITTPPNQTTTINTAASLQVASVCPNTPCTYSMSNAPIGLLISNTGLITGVPVVAGTVSVTVTVTDASGVTATTNPFTWAVLSPATVCVASLALPNGSFEAPVVSGGAPNWMVGGSSPLQWDTTEADNVIELWGNGGNAQSANGGLAIAAQQGIAWAELNANATGALYQNLATVPGQVLQWSVYHRARYSGNPNGLDVMQVQIGSTTVQTPQVPTGQTTPNISDGPTAWVRYTGVYTVPAGQTTTRFQFAAITTASGDNSVGNFIDNLSLNNNIACLIGAAPDRTSTISTAIPSTQLALDRGTGPFTWGGGATLPAGLSISTTGLITGTPTALGVTPVVLTFTDATMFQQTVSFTWSVVPRPTITTPAAQSSSVGAPVNLALVKSCLNGPCLYALNNGPGGLTIDANGVVSGTITGSAQTFSSVSVTVTDAAGASATSGTFVWTVKAAPTVVTPANQTSSAGSSISLAVGSTCALAPCTFTLTNAPFGLSISTSGVISGSPSVPGTLTAVSVTIQDAAGSTATTANFTWTVTSPPTVTSPGSRTTTTGTAVSLAVAYTCPNTPCTFSLANAPVGLTINATTGVISGTVTSAAGTSFNSVVTIRDTAAVTGTTGIFVWSIVARPTVTAPAAQTTTIGAAVSLQLTTTCPNAPCAYVLNNGPSGLAVSSTGLVSGTVSGSAQTFSSVSVTVADSSAATATTALFTWTVQAPLVITAPGDQTSTRGTAITALLLSATGGSGTPYTWTDPSGTLPSGLTIATVTNQGRITGTPTAAGTYAVQLTVKDSGNAHIATVAFTWTVVNPALVATTPATQNSTRGTTITSLQLTATGGSGTYAWSGSVPAGLTLSPSGLITGAPTTAGTTAVTLTVISGTASQTVSFTWNVVNPALVVTNPGTQNSTRGTAITALQMTATGGSGTYAWSGAVPAGLTLSPSGLITGTPTTAGTTAVTLTVVSGTTQTVSFSWVVVNPALIVTNPGTQTSTRATSITALQLTATGGSGTYVWSGAVPAGLTLSPTGLITGAPTTAGTTAVTLTVVSGTTQTVSFSWIVVNPPTVTTPAAQTSTANVADSLTVASTCPNTPCTFLVSGAPTGLTINGSGVISGTPTAAGTFTVRVTLTDAAGATASTSNFTWTVYANPLALTPPANQTSTVSTPDSLQLVATGGSGSYTWTATPLPAGLTLNANTGLISGTPTVTANAVTVAVRVTDTATASTLTGSFTWAVAARPTVASPGNNVASSVGASLTLPLFTSCPNGPCTYALINGPSTFTISATGVITGSFTGPAATFNGVTLTVTDNAGAVGTSSSFTVVVNPAPFMTTPATQTVTASTADSLDLTVLDGGGTAPYSYSASGLPSWLTLNANSGIISGTSPATASSTTGITVSVTDSVGVTGTSGTFTWTVVSPLVASNPGTQRSTVGTPDSLQMVATGGSGSYAWTGTVPAGFSLTSDGLITGSPTTVGSTFVTLTVTDATAATSKSVTFTWTIVAKPTVTAPANQTTTVGGAVNLSLATTCPNTTCTYVLTGAPAGLAISSTGVITGTITSSAQVFATVTVKVTDSAGASATSAAFTWTVNKSTSIGTLVNPVWSVSNSRAGATGVVYTYTFTTVTTANPLSTVTMTVPPGTTGSAVAVTGLPAGTISFSGNLLTYTLGTPTFQGAGTAVSIRISGLTNTTTPGTYIAQLVTNGATGGGTTVALDSASTGPISFGSATLVNPVWSASNTQTAATGSSYTYNFTTATAATLSSVTMSVPPGTAGTPTVAVTGLPAGTVSLSGGALTFTITSPTAVAAGTGVSIKVSGLTNTSAVGTYASNLTTNIITDGVSSPTDTAPSTPLSFSGGTINPIWSVTNSRTSATAVNYRYAYTTTTTGNNLSSVTVTVPAGTTGTPVATVTGFTAASPVVSRAGAVITLSFTPVYLAAGTPVTITFSGLINTTVVDTFTSQVVTLGALSGGAIIPLDSGQSGPVSFTASALANPLWSTSKSQTAATAAVYTFGFATATTATLSSVTLAVASGTTGTPTVVVTGLGAGAISLSGALLTYTITNPVAVNAGTAITVRVSGLVNPTTVGTYTSQLVTNVTNGGDTVPVDSAPAGPVSFTSGVLGSPVWTVSSTAANATGATYTAAFTTGSSATISSVTFSVPPGTAGAPVLGPVSGLGAGTISFAGNVMTYTVTTPAFVNSGTVISIRVTGLTNTSVSGAYTSQFVTNSPNTSTGVIGPLDSALTGAITFA
ncbi:MAG: dystroglycan-type cadherin-like domain repeat protein [Pseudonocardiales bacterium]|nr:dystroglycan-type cadherin-like domain repeat protein [Pseudonocardiales bacterium]